MTTQDKKDTEWLAYAVQMCPDEATVLQDDEIDKYLNSLNGSADLWLFGRHVSMEYLRLRKTIMDKLELAVPEKEKRNNAALLGTFEIIEEEECLI
jgi:hypothetical protein